MDFIAWIAEFATAFYSTYTTSASDENDLGEILTTLTSAATVVGVPNAYNEDKDAETYKTASMYVESLSDTELKELKDNLNLVKFEDDNLVNNKGNNNLKKM